MAKAKKITPPAEPVEQEETSIEVRVSSDEQVVTEQVAAAISDESQADNEPVAGPVGTASSVGKTAVQAEDLPVEQLMAIPEKTDKPVRKTKTGKTLPKVLEAESKQPTKPWWQTVLIAIGLGLTLLIFVAGAFSQLYKGKALPNISVAGVASGGKSAEVVQTQVEDQVKTLKITLQADKKTLAPTQKEIGYSVDAEKTAQAAVDAKRDGLFNRFFFWKKVEVPAIVSVNDTLLSQYLDNKLPDLTKVGQDAQLVYDPAAATFTVTTEKNGSGPDAAQVKEQLLASADKLDTAKVVVKTTKKPAKITKTKLAALVEPANEIVATSVVLQGSAGNFQAQPADIAVWVTPTPQKDGSVKLVIDPAKVQSYVESIGQQISSAPQDKKVIKDKKTSKQVILQEGRDGTELADVSGLAAQITQAIKSGQDVTLQMNIKTAKAKTINLQGYDKWIEVDLTKQTATAYQHATPVKSFVVATGLPGHETVTGEFAIYLKVRKQTMIGGSKADGSYYNIPNVEWVSYFHQDYALHGAWWRKVFGAPASHGCVNMTNVDAQWVYNWAPVGTKVIVHY